MRGEGTLMCQLSNREAASGIVPAVSPKFLTQTLLGESPGSCNCLGSQIIQMSSKTAGLCSQHMNSAWSCPQSRFPRQPETTKRMAKEAELPSLPLLLWAGRHQGLRSGVKSGTGRQKKWENVTQVPCRV